MDKNKQRYVISQANLPTELPFWQTIVLLLVYDRFPPSSSFDEIMWGIATGFWIIFWVVSLISFATEKREDIFKALDVLTKISAENIIKIVKMNMPK